MTMLDRAARALSAEDARRYEESSGRKVDLYSANTEMYKRLARAVLMAVRDPDDEMINRAGWSDYDVGGWIEGIDSILAEKA